MYGYTKIKIVVTFYMLCFASFIWADQTADLIGTWYGEKQKGPQQQKWLITRDDSGKFELVTKVFIDDFMLMEKNEEGSWSVEKNIYNVKIKKITDLTGTYKPQTPDGYYLDKYEIMALTPGSFTYKHTGSGNEYTTKRVSNDFTF